MSKPIFLLQLFVVLALAGSSAWLGQVWRLQAVEYEAEKDRQAGIAKQRLVSEGEKRKAEIIAQAEAEAMEMRGLIDGRAAGQSRVIEEAGETSRVGKLNVSTQAQAYALDTISGLATAAARFKNEAAKGGADSNVYQTIAAYLLRAAANQEKQRSEAWAVGAFGTDCSSAQRAASNLAKELMRRIDNSPMRGIFQPRR